MGIKIDTRGYGRLPGLNRRAFLKGSAMGAAGVAAAGALGGLPPRAFAKDPLVFSFWPWGSEIVTSNAELFMKENDEAVDLQPIPGDYAAVLETKLASGAGLDMFYAQRGQASRWHAAGWIRPVDDMPGLDQIRSEMIPGLDQDTVAYNGDYLGLTYYNGGPFCLFLNLKPLQEWGFEATANPGDYPQTWDEVAKIARELKAKGISENPILPAWYNAWTGLPWALIAQGFSEGEQFVDADLRATYGPDTPILKVLTDWKQWWEEGLIPKGILTTQESTMSDMWVTGQHAFHTYMDYIHFIYGDRANKQIGEYNLMNPVMPGATQDTVLVGHALLCTGTHERSHEDVLRAWELMKFYGWKDGAGDYHTHKRWAMKANLPIPYQAVYDDLEVKAALLKWMHAELGEAQYKWQAEGRARSLGPNLLKSPWHQEWDTYTWDMIANDLIVAGDVTPKEVVEKTRKRWDKLQKKYTQRERKTFYVA